MPWQVGRSPARPVTGALRGAWPGAPWPTAPPVARRSRSSGIRGQFVLRAFGAFARCCVGLVHAPDEATNRVPDADSSR